MDDNRLDMPWGWQHIEDFVEPRYAPGDEGHPGVILGIAMEKATGKWQSDRMEQYKRHFDVVFYKSVLEPVLNELDPDGYKITKPSIDYDWMRDWKAGEVQINILFWWGKERFGSILRISREMLYDPRALEHLRDSVGHMIQSYLNKQEAKEMWAQISNEKRSILKRIYHERIVDVTNNVEYYAMNQLATDGYVTAFDLIEGRFVATDKLIKLIPHLADQMGVE